MSVTTSNKPVHFISLAATQDYAAGLAEKIPVGSVLALIGDLGTGKTTFTQGFARGMGIEVQVGSPTFKIVSEYQGRDHMLYHVDAYRLKDGADFMNIGGENLLYPEDGVTMIEWADLIEEVLPDNVITIRFNRIPGKPDERMIMIEGLDSEAAGD